MKFAGHDPRDVVHGLVAGIDPFDEHEADDKEATLRWVRTGAPLFRVAPPATPGKHLCVYIALFDEVDDPAEWASNRFDPQMARFRDKLKVRSGELK